MKLKRVFCLSVALVLSAQPIFAKRIALVIGNSNYGDGLTLKNPVNDAHAVANSLRQLQFTVIERTDVNITNMEAALREFTGKIDKGDFAWFFYAGHGLQAKNINYLLPVGAQVKEAFELKRQAMDLDTIKQAMMDSGAKLNVVVLDCCRDNPFTRSWTRGITRGLAPSQEVPDGMIVAYSTAANTTALDGEGANSPYTSQLVNVLNSRPADGLEIKQVFFTVGQTLKKAIDQRPYLELDATMESYYLDRDAAPGNPGAEAAATVPAPNAPPAVAVAPPNPTQTFPAPAPTYNPQAAPNMPPAPVPGTQVVYVTPPGVTNTLSGVFANGPYAAYNAYSQGQVLRKVQAKLQSANLYRSKIDGGMGAGTQAAINAWQQSNNLQVTGLLDQPTLQSMMLIGLAEQNAPSGGNSVHRSNGGGGGGDKSEGGGDGGNWWSKHGASILGGMRGRPF